jgi:hypothetical protein
VDVGPWRSQLNAFLKEGTRATLNVAQLFVLCALAERDHERQHDRWPLFPRRNDVEMLAAASA